jgi:hypothetical protein
MAYGTLTISDLLATRLQSVAEVGEQNVFQAIDDALQAHNQLMEEQMAEFVDMSTDRQRRYGGPDSMTMDEVDEGGLADAQKVQVGQTVGFPLRKFQRPIQWTRDYFRRASAKEIAEQFIALQDADVQTLRRDMARAIFYPTNYTYNDRYVDEVDLAVKRLLNADSTGIPVGPNGETFDGTTHTHFLATSSLVAADVTSLLETVIEHHAMGQSVLNINRAQETAMRALSGFTPYLDAKLIPATNANQANGTLDQSNLYNRAIGVWNSTGTEVWVKPWVPSSYMFATIIGAPKPLVMRYDPVYGNQLEMAVDNENFPLRARAFQRHAGFGVWTRTNGAVLYIGGGSYVTPTIN